MTALPSITRFAPSPNGELHLGHAYSALFSAEIARRLGGQFLLRIEDIDRARCKDHYRQRIFADLTWLGLSWPEPVLLQSNRLPHYREALSRLSRLGVIYPCFCSRKEVIAAAGGRTDPDSAPFYPGTCRDLNSGIVAERKGQGEEFSLRLDVRKAQAMLPEPVSFTEMQGGKSGEKGDIPITPYIWGDVILARKDIGTSYHLAVVVDDAFQDVTDVTRGEDLFHATHIHRLLQELLQLRQPAYHHHPLVDDETGRKLSKRFEDQSLRSLRENGVTAKEIRNHLGFD